MADPLSVAASIIAVVQVVAMVTKAVYTLKQNLGEANKILCQVNNDMENLKICLSACERAIKTVSKTANPLLTSTLSEITGLVKTIRSLLHQLDAEVKACTPSSGSGAGTTLLPQPPSSMDALRAKRKWAKEKSNVTGLSGEIKNAKSNLILLLNSAGL